MVRSIRQFERLRDEWDALSASSRSPLLEHDWLLSCAEAFYREDDLRIVTARRGQSLAGAVPLADEASPAGRRLMLLGVSRLYEPSGWLVTADSALEELVDRTLALGRPMILQRIPRGSAATRRLLDVPRHRALTLARTTAPALGVNTSGSWDAYNLGLSSHIRSNLQRLRRKAEKALGPVRYVQHEPGRSDVDPLLEKVVEIEGSGWKGRRGSSIGARPDLRQFFQRYCRRAAERRTLRVSMLTFGSRVAAAELSIEAYGRMWQLKIGYDDGAAAYYPGLQLTAASIRTAFDRGLASYEFLGSAATWEEQWRPDVREYQTVAVYPVTALGLTGVCREAARVGWQRTMRAAAGVVTRVRGSHNPKPAGRRVA